MLIENMKIMKEYAELVLAGKSVSHLESSHVNYANWSKANGDAFLSDNVKYRWGTPEKEMVKHKGGVYPKPLTKEQILAVPDGTPLYRIKACIYDFDKNVTTSTDSILYLTLEDAEAAYKVLMNE